MDSRIKKELEKQYSNSKIPEFTYRMSDEEISSHPCFNCLRETEIAINKSYWKKFSIPVRYWYEMCDAESREIKKFISKLKPKTILEIGCGSGRAINILLSIKYQKKIYAVEKDSKMVKIVKPLFRRFNNVFIFNKEARDYLNQKIKFDLTVCMMNTFGNIDDLKLLKLIAEHSQNFIFTVYDQKYYKLREKIYLSKGHRKFLVKNKTYYFNDCWVKGLKSKSYTKKELQKICRFVGKKFKIKKISKLLFLVYIYE